MTDRAEIYRRVVEDLSANKMYDSSVISEDSDIYEISKGFAGQEQHLSSLCNCLEDVYGIDIDVNERIKLFEGTIGYLIDLVIIKTANKADEYEQANP